MLRVALTGGIGSGKTAVSDRFRALGVHVVDSDLLAREVVEPGTPGLAAVAEEFGAGVVDGDGLLDRAALRAIVFEDPARRRALEGILHPRIRTLMRERILDTVQAYAVAVIPLLLETGQQADFDRVLVVDVPEDVQIERVRRRNGLPDDEIRRMVAAQASRAERLAVADDRIDNTGPVERLDDRVAELHQRYLALAAQNS